MGHMEEQSSPVLIPKTLLWTMRLSLPKRFLGDVGMPEWKWTFRQLKWKRFLGYRNHSVFLNSLLPLWMTPIAGKQTCKPRSASVLQPQTHSGASLLHAGACSRTFPKGHSTMLKVLMGVEVAREGRGCCKPSRAQPVPPWDVVSGLWRAQCRAAGNAGTLRATGDSPSRREVRISPVLICLIIKWLS